MNMPPKTYVPLTGCEPAAVRDPAADIADGERLDEFRRLLKKTKRPHAALARQMWALYEADEECRLPREYIALFQRVLGETPYKLRLARALIGDLLVKSGVL